MPKVVIVDDSKYMRTMLKCILGDAGFEVVGEASDAESAIEQILLLKPDLVTLDVILPDETGLEVLKEIKAKKSEAKVLLVSAVGQEVIIQEGKELGAEDFIEKPFSEEKVIRTVRKIIPSPTF